MYYVYFRRSFDHIFNIDRCFNDQWSAIEYCQKMLRQWQACGFKELPQYKVAYNGRVSVDCWSSWQGIIPVKEQAMQNAGRG